MKERTSKSARKEEKSADGMARDRPAVKKGEGQEKITRVMSLQSQINSHCCKIDYE